MSILKLRNTHKYRGVYDINTDLEETCYEDVDWISMPQGQEPAMCSYEHNKSSDTTTKGLTFIHKQDKNLLTHSLSLIHPATHSLARSHHGD